MKSLIQQMEAYYDAQQDEEEASGQDAATEVNLSPAIERFLSELGEQMDNEE